jgi:prepilin-type processing-associated H-X9-DG protein
LGQARRAGRATVCLSQTRQYSVALAAYGNDFKDRCFLYDTDNIYILALREYHQNIEALRYCPDAKTKSDPSSGNTMGTARLGWLLDSQDGSYTFNGYLYSPFRGDPMPSFAPRDRYPDAWWRTLSKFDFPSMVPTFADGIWVDAWPSPLDTVPSNLETGWRNPGAEFPYHTGRYCIKRHGRAINMSYADGHSSIVPINMLWDQQWSKTYRRTGPRAGL